MTNEKMKDDLEGQIQDKAAELEKRKALLESYAKTYGRDRWYNRGCQDVVTLKEELAALMALQGAVA